MAKDLFEDLFDSESVIVEADEAKQLETLIEHLDTLYEAGEDCIHPDTERLVADAQYDDYKNKLFKAKPNSYIFETVTASKLDSQGGIVVHDPPMTSISKINGTDEEKEEDLTEWLKASAKSEKDFVMGYKHDGVACSLYYKDGALVSAGLRPRDGIHGENVVDNVQFVKDVPLELPVKVTCVIRGELECLISVFNSLNGSDTVDQRVFANPRNYTAGSVRQFKDCRKTGKRNLSFTAYSVENLDNPPYKTEIERAKWVSGVLGIPFIELVYFKHKKLEVMEEVSGDLDFEVDGIVISVNDLEEQEQLGRHGDQATGNPKGKIAWKFRDEIARVIVKNIRWQAGRTGKLTPVLEFDAVQLEGTQVTQCTAHNAGVIMTHAIQSGVEVEIKKSGKIIPKFERVISKIDGTFDLNVDKCPSCGSAVAINKSGSKDKGDWTCEFVCKNKECPAKHIKGLMHYLTTIGVKGLADSTIKKLIESGLVKVRSDFYYLDFNDLQNKVGFTERQSALILARIFMLSSPEKNKDTDKLLLEAKDKKTVSVPIEKFIAALGIIGASKGTARALVSHFSGDLNKIMNASIDELVKVEDIGEKTAIALEKFFEDNDGGIDELLRFVELELPKTGKLSGKTFVFSGSFPDGKETWQNAVAELGAKIGTSVSNKTDYVVIGPGSGAKEKKATELGITKLDIEDLQEML